jgi:hypothetical protein
MNQYIYVRPRDDGQGWAVDVYDGRRAWTKTHLGERPLNKAEAHRVAHKLRDPKFYSARTKRAVNSRDAGHEWAPHERDGWSVCSRCGLVRNYDRETPCRGTMPEIHPRDGGMGEARVGTMPGSGIPLPCPPFGISDGEAREAARVRAESFCACGRRLPECDGSRAGCLGSTGEPGVRDTKNPCDMFSPGKPTNGGCQSDGHYLCRECGLFDDRGES